MAAAADVDVIVVLAAGASPLPPTPPVDVGSVAERRRCNFSGLVCGDNFALNVASRSAALVCTDDAAGTLIVADMLVLTGDVGEVADGGGDDA